MLRILNQPYPGAEVLLLVSLWLTHIYFCRKEDIMARKLVVVDGVIFQNSYQPKRKNNRGQKNIRLINGQLIKANDRMFCRVMIEKSKKQEKKKDLTHHVMNWLIGEDTSKIVKKKDVEEKILKIRESKFKSKPLYHKISLNSLLEKGYQISGKK
jgi:hypothetical protein